MEINFVCFILGISLALSYGATVSHETVAASQGTTPRATSGVVTAKPAIMEKAGEDLLLVCEVSVPTDSVMKWYKNGVEITDDSKHHTKHINHTLEVDKVGPEDVGEYFCVITINDELHNVSVELLAAPQIKHFEPNTKNLVQGDPLVLECNIWGWPHPVVSWRFNSTELNTTDTRIKISPNSHGVPNAKLRLENVDYPDGGDYECVGTNKAHANSSSIKVVIKDKYAALWPFLAICAEVAILCTIIFIYERRHAHKLAQQEEEEAKQEEAEHLASNNEKKDIDEVRHRDVKT